MDPLDLNLWRDALAQIQSQLPTQAYETWFQPTRAVSSTSTSLVIEVPNAFFRDWLASHYTELVHRVLENLTRSKIRVEYSIPSRSGKEPPASGGPAPTTSTAAPQEACLPDRQGVVVPLPPAAAEPPVLTPRAADLSELTLNPRYTFEQFVVGSSNRFAHAAALAISDSPAKVYNPLFIYGGVGLGKTHLMQALGQRLKSRFPQFRCLYLSSERFTNQLITAIQNRTMAAFRDRYRSVDVLLVDDIHFIGGKESTQEVFFHTFNTLYDAHRQIVISSDRPPKELKGVEERMISRFEWGLVTDVQPPDLETRVAILRKKAQTQGQKVPDEVTLFIAERVSSNIRELEGALNRVIAYGVLASRDITLGMAQEVLKGLVAETAKHVTLDRIQRVVANYFHLPVSDLKGKRRTKELSFCRHVAMALCRQLTESSLPSIGEAFGGRDHATVFYACQKMVEAQKVDGALRGLFDDLVVQLKKNCG